jgi:hypothetical protein
VLVLVVVGLVDVVVVAVVPVVTDLVVIVTGVAVVAGLVVVVTGAAIVAVLVAVVMDTHTPSTFIMNDRRHTMQRCMPCFRQ